MDAIAKWLSAALERFIQTAERLKGWRKFALTLLSLLLTYLLAMAGKLASADASWTLVLVLATGTATNVAEHLAARSPRPPSQNPPSGS